MHHAIVNKEDELEISSDGEDIWSFDKDHSGKYTIRILKVLGFKVRVVLLIGS